MRNVLEALLAAHDAQRPCVYTALVETRGSTPQKPGAAICSLISAVRRVLTARSKRLLQMLDPRQQFLGLSLQVVIHRRHSTRNLTPAWEKTSSPEGAEL